MDDLSCIYEMSLVDEKDTLKEDILKGHALEILISLLAGNKTAKELAREINVPVFSIQLYINRLLKVNLIVIKSTTIIDGKLEKIYSLAAKDVDILNNLKNSNSTDTNIDLSAQHFSTLTRQVIKNINRYKDKTYKIKAYFIKTDEATMKDFKKELDQLFEKYQGLEDENATETYGFISVLAPYGME